MNQLFTRSKTISCLLSLGGLLALSAAAAPAAKAQTWMVSTTSYVKLGVLDKYNALGGYTAVFIVTSEKNGEQYFLSKTVPKNESGVDVLFPSEPNEPEYFKTAKDLAPPPAPGRYTWECRVNGKRAVGGFFVYGDCGNDVRLVQK